MNKKGGLGVEKKVSHLRDELRRTFTIYALVPIFLLSLLTAAFAAAYWHTNVVGRSQQRAEEVSAFLDSLLATTMAETARLSADCQIERLQSDTAYRVKLYQQLYEYMNRSELFAGFFLLDKERNVILSSNSQEPEFLHLTKDVSWGIVQRIEKNPQRPVYEFMSDVRSLSQEMNIAVGQAIVKEGKIEGYMVYIISGARLLAGMESPYVHILVKDRYDYVPICTDRTFATRFNKLQEGFLLADGYLSVENKPYYVTRSELLGGELTVYAVTAVGQLIGQLIYAVCILLGVLLVLTLTVIIRVRTQAAEKTKTIDQLVEAFAAARAGDLSGHVEIQTNNEFQLIGEAYNVMVDSLRQLMVKNQEQARETVISEIKQLESQFNPHFLFNTLENIKFMIRLDPDAASRMILSLSSLLRYSINNTVSRVCLQEDLQYIQNYLDIQKVRFGSRLNYVLQVETEVRDAVVPKLLMQPVVENAIKYGMRDGGHLEVRMAAVREKDDLMIEISNNGSLILPEVLQEIREMLVARHNFSTHSGLYNIHRRIQLLYGEAYGLTIDSELEKGTRVKLVIPYQKEEKKNAECHHS